MNNKKLYNQIMFNISREIKHILNEDIQRFNVDDYEEDDSDLIDSDTIELINKKPKSLEEEEEFFIKTKVSEESLDLAKKFAKRIENCLNPLMPLKLSEKCLNYNDGDFYLYGSFLIISNFEEEHIEESFEYAQIDFAYNFKMDQFELTIDIEKLAKMIEFCSLYKNRLSFHFTGHKNYYEEFQIYIKRQKIKGVFTQDIFIFPSIGDYDAPKFVNQTNKIFKKIELICEKFVLFVPKYLKEYYF